MSERTLILLRHAKSDWSGRVADVDRPLGQRGLRQAHRAGRWLARMFDRIDLAVASPATRARSTWEIASAELDNPPPVRFDDRMYAASGMQLLAVVRDLPGDVGTVIMVGHNPGFEDVVVLLTGEPVSMPTAAFAVIGLAGTWSAAGRSPAKLRTAGRPPAA
ncbi:MAG: histidine phosphatase family protein [Cryobacterium sp.]